MSMLPTTSVDAAMVVAAEHVDIWLELFAIEAELRLLERGATVAELEVVRSWLYVDLLIVRYDVLEQVNAWLATPDMVH